MKEKAHAIAVESDDEKVPGDVLPFLKRMQKKGLTLSEAILNLQNPKNRNQEIPDEDEVAPIVPRVNQFQGKNDRLRSNGDEEEVDESTAKKGPKPKQRPGRGRDEGRDQNKRKMRSWMQLILKRRHHQKRRSHPRQSPLLPERQPQERPKPRQRPRQRPRRSPDPSHPSHQSRAVVRLSKRRWSQKKRRPIMKMKWI